MLKAKANGLLINEPPVLRVFGAFFNVIDVYLYAISILIFIAFITIHLKRIKFFLIAIKMFIVLPISILGIQFFRRQLPQPFGQYFSVKLLLIVIIMTIMIGCFKFNFISFFEKLKPFFHKLSKQLFG
jgi:hypothetical protein